MIVTEAQAHRLVCPLNAGKNISGNPHCLGSECMWWAWSGERVRGRRFAPWEDQKSVTEPPRPVDLAADWIWVPYDESEDIRSHWVEPEASAALRRTGTCGAVRCP